MEKHTIDINNLNNFETESIIACSVGGKDGSKHLKAKITMMARKAVTKFAVTQGLGKSTKEIISTPNLLKAITAYNNL